MTAQTRDLLLTFLGTFLIIVAGVSVLTIPIHAAFALIEPPTQSGGWVRVFLLPVLYLAVGLCAGAAAMAIRRRLKRGEAERPVTGRAFEVVPPQRTRNG